MSGIIQAVIQRALWCIYRMPLWAVVLCLVLGMYIWVQVAFCERAYKPDRWRLLNIVFFVCSVFAVVAATLLYRSGDNGAPDLIPFHFIARASSNPEAIRAFVMNILLFVPFGMTLPFVFGSRRLFTVILLAAAFSAAVELVQYLFHLGKAEADDLIANTAGAAAGLLPYIITWKKTEKKESLL